MNESTIEIVWDPHEPKNSIINFVNKKKKKKEKKKKEDN